MLPETIFQSCHVCTPNSSISIFFTMQESPKDNSDKTLSDKNEYKVLQEMKVHNSKEKVEITFVHPICKYKCYAIFWKQYYLVWGLPKKTENLSPSL